MKILIVEDNERLAERIQYKLSKDFVVDVVSDGEDALDRCTQIQYAVIILDLNLPSMSGLDVCTALRKMNNDVPILILSGLNAITTRVELLNLGADDYLTKPFDANELKARISALMRRRERHAPLAIIEHGELFIDTATRTVSRKEIPITLRRKEFDLLVYLVQNSGRILTRQMIMDHVWSSDSSSWLSTIDVHIKHLRDKIDRPFDSPYIKTAYGVGYKMDKLHA